MKIKLFFLLFLLSHIVIAQQVTQAQRIERFIHIWGLVKYKHPDASRGKIDMNTQFITEFNRVKNLQEQAQLNSHLLQWVNSLTTNRSADISTDNQKGYGTTFTKNEDYDWIEKSGFSEQLVTKLKDLKNNTAIGDYYVSLGSLTGYPNFSNEKPLKDFDATNAAHRVLFLGTFWNMMRYWNVNIYLTDQKWDEALTEMIPVFLKADPTEFEYAKEKLIAKINDSHADYQDGITMQSMKKYAVFGGRIVNDSLVVTFLRNAAMAQKDNVALGDVIFAAEGKSLGNYYREKFGNAMSASNDSFLKRRIEKFLLFAGTDDYVNVSILKKDGTIYNGAIKLYELAETPHDHAQLQPEETRNYYAVTPDIGYINLGTITKEELRAAFKELEKTTGLIIDLRSYPKTGAEIADYLYPEKKVFVKVLLPQSPSVGEYEAKSPLRAVSDPFAAGGKNENNYKGKVVLLVDRGTASQGEWLGMMVQNVPGCVTIGEQTFGAVMNRVTIKLLDKTSVDFTFAGAFYPDGTGVQRTGLKVDIPVKECAKSFNPNLYMEEALKVFEQKVTQK